jgi:D-alanyl-D-alanine carboxypeptidase/D-alanyl-D-alanine-endopeptidase (penicillin-binding protein 4)
MIPALPDCFADPSLTQPAVPAPPDLATALAAFLADARVAPHAVSVSVWVDGLGEVLGHEPDRALAPASNEKLFTAMGALAVLGADTTLTTELRVTPSGDLAVVGGGDATVTATGPHSLDTLAALARDHGVGVVTGALLVDETGYDGLVRAPAWQDWQIPAHTGPLSAFMVDRNRWRGDAAYVAAPAHENAELLRAALARRGIVVQGPTVDAAAPATGTTVASLPSAPVRDLVRDMLLFSDNQVADLLLREVGRAAAGTGSLAGGAQATTDALRDLCVPITGAVDDGSGLSRGNARSAREWRTMLQAARGQSWWPLLADGLPLAGRSGTLAGRFRGTAAEANVRAKTGTIIGGTALTGYGTTARGRPMVFSVVVNGPGAEGAAGAVDQLVAAVAASTS